MMLLWREVCRRHKQDKLLWGLETDLPSNVGILVALKCEVAYKKGPLKTKIYLFQVPSVIIDSKIPLWSEGLYFFILP